MDLTMSIAALSVTMHQAEFQQDYDIAMLKQSMDSQEAATYSLIDMLSAAPSNHILDTWA